MVMHACACSTTLYIWPNCATAQVCKLYKATDVCSTIGNAKESYNNLCQVKALVPVTQTCACSNTPQVWPHYAITCFCQVVKATRMCGTVRNVCNWHHLMELIVALLWITDSAAHACGLRNLA